MVVRLLVLLLGMLTSSRADQRQAPWPHGAAADDDPSAQHTVPQATQPSHGWPGDAGGWPDERGTLPGQGGGRTGHGGAGPGDDGVWARRTAVRPGQGQGWPGSNGADPRAGGGLPSPARPLPPRRPGGLIGRLVVPGPRRRRRIPRWVKWVAALAVLGLIFRKAVAFAVITALSAALHLVGVNLHLPNVKFGWPWQSVTAGTTTTVDLGPWVLQKIEGISKPALGEANFSFYFTHKVSKSIGFWPCWYSSTFYAVAHASATVNLNPGPSWWRPATGHYRLNVISRPWHGKPGHVAVTMILPPPQLPRSPHDAIIDNIPSKPISSDHSWTYPGLGCGVALRPQFSESVLYAQAQQIAYYKSRNAPGVTRPLVRTAETQATRIIRDNFIQPTVNAFGYDLDRFTLLWATRA
jgi:hypothetical protein